MFNYFWIRIFFKVLLSMLIMGRGIQISLIIFGIIILIIAMFLILFPNGKVIIDDFDWRAVNMLISHDSNLAIINTGQINVPSNQALFNLNTGGKILDIPTIEMERSSFSRDLDKIFYITPNEKFASENGYTRYSKIYQIDISTKETSLLTQEEYSLYSDPGAMTKNIPQISVFALLGNKIIYSCRNPLIKEESLHPEFGYCELDINSGIINNLGNDYQIDTEKYSVSNIWPDLFKIPARNRTIERTRVCLGACEGIGCFGRIYSLRVDGKLKYRGFNSGGKVFVAPNEDVYLLSDKKLRKLA